MPVDVPPNTHPAQVVRHWIRFSQGVPQPDLDDYRYVSALNVGGTDLFKARSKDWNHQDFGPNSTVELRVPEGLDGDRPSDREVLIKDTEHPSQRSSFLVDRCTARRLARLLRTYNPSRLFRELTDGEEFWLVDDGALRLVRPATRDQLAFGDWDHDGGRSFTPVGLVAIVGWVEILNQSLALLGWRLDWYEEEAWVGNSFPGQQNLKDTYVRYGYSPFHESTHKHRTAFVEPMIGMSALILRATPSSRP